jgi:eukaryotic-like serine/threonine-protein kinase
VTARSRWLVRGYAFVCLCWLAVVVVAQLGTLHIVVAAIAAALAGVLAVLLRNSDDSSERGLGGYTLVELLGTGGMGEVWRAEHEALIRPAAVKLMRRELIGSVSKRELDAMTARFQREVQVTATLTSPHTIEVFDFGQTADGSLYYVMELLHGLDLETLVLEHGPQPAERVVHLMSHACASLAEAHHRNLIHRDIKPANIYACAVGMEVDFVKVLDFGLVRDLNNEHRLTIQGSTPGTPAYLAPEFVLDRVDHRADLYALGCVAYWLLTAQLVFEADSKVAMMAAHSSEQPLPPSKRTELPIPRELDDLVLALLAKDPADRPQDAAELALRLAAVPLATPWTPQRAEAWWQTHLPGILAKGREGVERKTPLTPRHDIRS